MATLKAASQLFATEEDNESPYFLGRASHSHFLTQ